MATNKFGQGENATQAPATRAVAITPHDTTELTETTRAIYVGGAGNIVMTLEGDTAAVTFVSVSSGSILPVRAKLVKSTSTTATSLVALY